MLFWLILLLFKLFIIDEEDNDVSRAEVDDDDEVDDGLDDELGDDDEYDDDNVAVVE